MELKDLAGQDLGTRTIAWDARDAILYALAVGASCDETDLVYERDLRVLPTYACALGLWAVERAGGLGAYDRNLSLHATQSLELHAPMPPSGSIEACGRVAEVWDKGKAAIVGIVVECEIFTARYGIFLPRRGGWGGERGPSASSTRWHPSWRGRHAVDRNRAALYRLTGDQHPIHIDIEVARANGFDRPILHGLCTLGIAARMLAEPAGAHPAELRRLEARLAAAVMPGDVIDVTAGGNGAGLSFEAKVGETAVLTAGRAAFG